MRNSAGLGEGWLLPQVYEDMFISPLRSQECSSLGSARMFRDDSV